MLKSEVGIAAENASAAAELQASFTLPEKQNLLRPNSADIAALAYRLWEERGCPDGEAERDWYEAE